MFSESTQNQRCFNVEFYRWINVDKSTLNQRGYHVDRRHDVISTYINVESTLSVCWVELEIMKSSRIVNFYKIKQYNILICYMATPKFNLLFSNVPFSKSSKSQKVFLLFQDIEQEHWEEMGKYINI